MTRREEYESRELARLRATRDRRFEELDRLIAKDKEGGSKRMRAAHKSLVREREADMLRRAREKGRT